MSSLSYSARTVFYFGIYLLIEGMILFLIPNILLSFIGLPETSEGWIRLVGMSLLILGYYYIMAAKKEIKEFFYWTVQIRMIQFFLIILMIFLNLIPAVILIFSLVEFMSGLWTWRAFKKL